VSAERREGVALVVPDLPEGLTPRLSEWVRDLMEVVGEKAGLESLTAIVSRCLTAVMEGRPDLGRSAGKMVEHRLKPQVGG
jgi:hypothetical protein